MHHVVSAATAQLCCGSMKAATDYLATTGSG